MSGAETPLILHRTLVWRLCMAFVTPITHLIYRVRFDGRERIPDGGCLLVSNHQSFLDIPLLSEAARPRHVSFLARDSLAKSRVLGFIMQQCGAVLVKRGASDRAALREVAAHLEGGDLGAIFPEGTRTPDGQVGEFKRGALLAARMAGAPILPCSIHGSHEAWPRGTKLPGAGRLSVRFGDPIDPREEGALEKVEAEVRRLYALGPVHRP